MAHATFVKKARVKVSEDDCGIEGGIKPGDSYYWWKFRRGGKHFSKTPPKRSDLTQSSFYAAIFDLEDEVIAKADADSGLAEVREEVTSALQEISDQCQESLDNMPEGLQQGSTGELLQERISAMENAINEFDSLELDEPGEDDLDWPKKKGGESNANYAKRKEAEREKVLTKYWEGKLQEFQEIGIEAP